MRLDRDFVRWRKGVIKQSIAKISVCSDCDNWYCIFCGLVIEEHIQIIENEIDYNIVNNHICPLKDNGKYFEEEDYVCKICFDEWFNDTKQDKLV
jgi:hypothetical protein